VDLYQGEFWQDEDGNLLRISEMLPHRAGNCAGWLEKNALAIAFVDSGKWIGLNSWVSGEQASYDLDCEIERDFADKEDPVAWIKGTDLWIALNERSKAKVQITIKNFFA
jgi:hypothetical protein